MNKFISKIEIKGLFGKKDISWNLDSVSVLVGKNGAGKSTIINTIYDLLRQDSSIESSLNQSEKSKLTLANDYGFIEYNTKEKKQNDEAIQELESIIKKIDSLKEINRATSDDNLDSLRKKIQETIEITTRFRKERDSIEKTKFKCGGLVTVNKDMINVELISTSNLNANSINEFKTSAGKRATILDIEIERELIKLKETSIHKKTKETKRLLSSLIDVADDLFNESCKKIKFKDEELTIHCTDDDNNIDFRKLSSGERQLLYILLKAANAASKNTVLLMDEPEISLHLSWQEKLIGAISKINNKCQLIIVTHSPAILMDGWFTSLTNMEDIEK